MSHIYLFKCCFGPIEIQNQDGQVDYVLNRQHDIRSYLTKVHEMKRLL